MHGWPAILQGWGGMFDWDDLRVFLAVARARKVAPAARALGIDATTIARRLARLEKALDAELFEMGAGERSLTARGQELLGHAEAAESAALAAGEEMRGQERTLAGQVRLSVAEGFGTWVLAPGMGDFNRRHPGIRLDLITASGFLNPLFFLLLLLFRLLSSCFLSVILGASAPLRTVQLRWYDVAF